MKEDNNSQNRQPFKAEISQLLSILTHSLYSEREIFLRELISNASDALVKMQFTALTQKDVLSPDQELRIDIAIDNENNSLIISDTGIGMTRDELTKNLGTIAQSGAREFMAAADDPNELVDMIGKFGVGFYSSFMVAESVTVASRSYLPHESAATWHGVGEDWFSIEDSEKSDRGTEIIIKLKDDSKEFLDPSKIRQIVKLYSDYVVFPIYLAGEEEPINKMVALWRKQPSSVEKKDYEEFYNQLTLNFNPPTDVIHYNVDAPIQVYSLLYIPGETLGNVFLPEQMSGVKLYARKVLIQPKSENLLPPYLRFVSGVVDTEDIPLNISRETIQHNAVILKLKRVLTAQVLKKLSEIAENDRETFDKFWTQYGIFLKEGIATDEDTKDKLVPLLRFKTSKNQSDWSSLNDYISRMQLKQKKIYYLLGEDIQSSILSPHLDVFKKHDTEVLLMTEPSDPFILGGLRNYEGFDLVNVIDADLDMVELDEKETERDQKPEEGEYSTLIETIKKQLGERVSDIRISNRLTNSIARLVDPGGGMNQEFRKMYKLMDKAQIPVTYVLEINPNHPIIQGLNELSPGDLRVPKIIDQIYENTLLLEGLHENPVDMIPRINELMEMILEEKQDTEDISNE